MPEITRPIRKVRIYSPQFPYPLTEAAFHIIFDQARSLDAMGLEVELVTWKDRVEIADQKRINACGHHPSFPRTVRMTHLQMQRFSHPIGRETGLERRARVLYSLLSGYASPELLYYPPRIWTELDQADLGIYHLSFAHSWLRKPSQEKMRCVVFHNLESELFQERAKITTNEIFKRIHFRNERLLRKHEAELLDLADELWFLSPKDLERFRECHSDALKLRLVPPTFPEEIRTASHAAKQTPEMIVGFLGGMDYFPNAHSASWVVDQLAPVLQNKNFKGKIRIVGKSAPESVTARAQKFPFIQFEGFIPNLEDYWAHLSYSLVPDIDGFGVRLKLLESVARGVPVLATKSAVERIHPALQSHPLIYTSDRPEDWADRIMESEALRERSFHSNEAFPEALLAKNIYSFLLKDK